MILKKKLFEEIQKAKIKNNTPSQNYFASLAFNKANLMLEIAANSHINNE